MIRVQISTEDGRSLVDRSFPFDEFTDATAVQIVEHVTKSAPGVPLRVSIRDTDPDGGDLWAGTFNPPEGS